MTHPVWADGDAYEAYVGAAPGYLTTLAEPARDALREALAARPPVEPDGSVHLGARAWAVPGVAAN
ncbi:hypothetical protein [Micromonospora sp. NPDC005203]|uniref:hypothetical protein n=1 Tax=Micromonospora sp. NPDC005203 TaxID=3364226 RepID=UPI0036C3ACBE